MTKNLSFEEIKNLDSKFVMPTYARMDLAFERGENATLFDVNGRDFIDFSSGIGVASVGHGNALLARAIATQAQNLIHTSNVFYIKNQALLAQKINALYGGQTHQIFFGNSGAEANECAIKIARKYGEKSGRFEIITLESSFHGRTLATLKATGQDKFHAHFAPFPEGFVRAKNLESVADSITEKTIAVLIELVQGEGGVSAQSVDAAQKLAQICQERDILLMVDEVQSGIYRSGELFAAQKFGIAPDVITMAKGIAGGVPMGACMSRVSALESSEHGSTFGGNPLSAAAALATLEILENLHRSGALAASITRFDSALDALLTKFPAIFKKKSGLGLMLGLQVVDDDALGAIIKAGIAHGVLVLKSGRSTLRFLPPLSISEREINLGFERLTKAIETI